MTSIKKEMSESQIPFLKKEEPEEHDFSFDSNDDEQLSKKQNSYDNLFKHENQSVDLFLKEITFSKGEEQDEEKIQLTGDHISPTKPLNLKNPSKTSLTEFLREHESEEEPQGIMQDIPINPNASTTAATTAIRQNSQLKGPRAVHQTPKGKQQASALKTENSPSKKRTVFIDASPPKIVEYDQASEEETEDAEEEEEEEMKKPNWKPLNPKKHKPLPNEPNSANSSMLTSPTKVYEDDDEEEEQLKDLHENNNLTTEDLANIEKMTLAEKLNAVLDTNNVPNVDFDHDKYLEDAKFKRTKSVVKRRSYYDDMLLNSLKTKDNNTEDYDGLADLYETNIRNTQSNKSLKLDLNRSNSLMSQFSIASGERVLETTVAGQRDNENDDVVADSSEEQILDPIQEAQAENHIADLTEISSNLDLFGADSNAKDDVVVKTQEPDLPNTPIKASHSRQSSLTDALSPYKMGAFLVNVGSNLRKIVSSQDLQQEVTEISVIGGDGNVEPVAKAEIEVEQPKIEQAIVQSADEDEDEFQSVAGSAAASIHHPVSDAEEENVPVKIEAEVEAEDEKMIGNSTELIDDPEASTTLEDSDPLSVIEITKHEFQIEANPEFDDDPHSFSLELEKDKLDSSEESVMVVDHQQPRKITSSNVSASSSSSPQTDVLSIWQSQPEYQHVPKHKTTRCTSIASSTVSRRSSMKHRIENKVLPVKGDVHVISQRLISKEYEDEELDMLPNISGDSDFGSSFKKFGIKIDEESEAEKEDEDVFQDSQDVLSSDQLASATKKNVQNIWRSGTIRSQHQRESTHNEAVKVYSDEDHQVRNVRSTFQVNQPMKTHKGHEASVESVAPLEIDSLNSINSSFRTIEKNELTQLSDRQHTPLGELTQSRINSLPPTSKAPAPPGKLVNGEKGRLFFRMNKLVRLDLPDLYVRKAKFCVILDNGIHRIQTEYFKLDDRIDMSKEFELVAAESLSFVLTFKAKYEKPSDTLIEVKEREVVKSTSFWGKLFNNKHIITRTKFVNKPAPIDPWNSIMAEDGSFAKVIIDLANYENTIRGRAVSYQLPLINEWNQKQHLVPQRIGTLDVQMLFLPRVSKFEILPTSIKQAYDELQLLADAKSVAYEGHLFQEGGDCKIMKRRFFKLEDSSLIAHNEDTLKTRCKINLTKVTELIYMTDEVKSDRNFSDNLLTNSFKLKFANQEIIEFNAQDKFEKSEWIEHLQSVINKNHFARQPWVKLMHERQ